MHFNEKDNDRFLTAQRKIDSIARLRKRLKTTAKGKKVDVRVESTIQMLTKVESRCRSMLKQAVSASRQLADISPSRRELKKRGLVGDLVGGLGSTIGSVASSATKGAEAILDSAVPITAAALTTASNLSKSIVSGAGGVAGQIVASASNTASNMVGTATNVASSLVGQAANLSSSLTQKVSRTVGGIAGGSASAISSMVDSILNPSSGTEGGIGRGLAGLASTVGKTASSLIGNATSSASALTSTAAALSSGLTESASNTAASILDSASRFATSMIGDAGSSLAQGIFGGSGSEGLVDVVGGAFGAAAGMASSLAGGASEAAAGLLTGGLDGVADLASGLGGLASSTLGSASDVVGGMADAALDAAGGMLGSAADVASDVLDAASSTAGSMLDTAGDIASGMVDGIGSMFSEDNPPSQENAEAMEEFSHGDDGGSSQDTDDGYNEDGDYGEESGGMDPYDPDEEGIADDAVQQSEDMADDMMDMTEGMTDDMMDAAEDAAEDLMDDTCGEIDDLIEQMDESLDDIEQNAEEMEDDFDPEGWPYPEDEVDEDDIPDEDEDPYYEDEEPEPDPDDEEDGSENQDGESQQTDDDKKDEPREKDENPLQETPPMSPIAAPEDTGLIEKTMDDKNFGWKSFKVEIPKGVLGLMHDGDQQLLNPYGNTNGNWTVYSFRPKDTVQQDKDQPFPQISITPASFEAISSMNDMLNNIPFVVVKEYFFKNVASTMTDFVKKILAGVENITKSPGNPAVQDNSPDKSSQGSADAKSTGGSFLDKVKSAFQSVTLQESAIDIPYILYCGLRKKLYGNTYIFPYIVNSGTVINSADNSGEWNDKNGSIFEALKKGIAAIAEGIGSLATFATGSQAQFVDSLFPAPTWKKGGAKTGEPSFSFELVLINDHIIKARNNYMCVNTIIHNNRQMQKAMLAFPGALYEIWLPTGQRHLMCTGSFTLKPVGLNRKTPKGFFKGDVPGANFQIGMNMGNIAKITNPPGKGHVDGIEVIPDAYKLELKFASVLPNNLNTSVFQYYVDMAGYEDYATALTGGSENQDSLPDVVANKISDGLEKLKGVAGKNPQNPESAPPTTPSNVSRTFSRAMRDLVENVEKFDESTYNKRLEKLKSQFGDMAHDADSVVMTVRRCQGVIRESKAFLGKLYDAKNNNMWYRPFAKEEIYTTLKPDYRQVLKKQYGQELQAIRNIDAKISSTNEKLNSVARELSKRTVLDERTPLLESKVKLTRRLNTLVRQREEHVGKSLQIDVDIMQAAWDEHDDIVSVKKNTLTPRIFKQVWNERIMNAYEKDKIQYMTSVEKKRYFNEKVRDLKKYDRHGVLTHEDWFFRVVALDFMVGEMQRLILWLKDCSYDDFDTIYKITRKLNMLLLDVDSARGKDRFDINQTNLFYISDEDMKEFTKLDGMLVGNTLYELFQSQVKLVFHVVPEKVSQSDSSSSDASQDENIEILKERQSEIDLARQRKVREDVVQRVWKSESNLTKAAYDEVNQDPEVAAIKDRIMELKINGGSREELQNLLGSFSNRVRFVKEELVAMEMEKMKELATREMDKKDDSALNGDVTKRD